MSLLISSCFTVKHYSMDTFFLKNFHLILFLYNLFSTLNDLSICFFYYVEQVSYLYQTGRIIYYLSVFVRFICACHYDIGSFTQLAGNHVLVLLTIYAYPVKPRDFLYVVISYSLKLGTTFNDIFFIRGKCRYKQSSLSAGAIVFLNESVTFSCKHEIIKYFRQQLCHRKHVLKLFFT